MKESTLFDGQDLILSDGIFIGDPLWGDMVKPELERLKLTMSNVDLNKLPEGFDETFCGLLPKEPKENK